MSKITPSLTNPFFITIIYLTGLALIFLIGTLFGVRRIPDSVQNVQDRLEPIYQNHPLSQSVTLHHDGFNVVVLYMRNAQNKNEDPLLFSLLDSENQPIRQINLNGYNIGDGIDVRLQFPPIPDSGQKTYTINITAPDTAFDEPKIETGFSNSGKLTHQLYYQPQNYFQLFQDLGEKFTTRLFHYSFLLTTLLFITVYIFINKLLFGKPHTPPDQ